MSLVSSYRLFNALENGTINGAQLETALTTDTRKLSEFKAGALMRNLFYRASASDNTMQAVLDSSTAVDYLFDNVEAREAVEYILNSKTAISIISTSSTLANKVLSNLEYAADVLKENNETMASFFESETGGPGIYPVYTYTQQNPETTSTINAVVFGNNRFVAVGDSTATANIARYSFDGVTWKTVSGVSAANGNALTYSGDLFVYGGVGGVLATSTDGFSWQGQTYGTTAEINALAYGSDLYVAAGASGTLRTSTDAITWTARTSGTASIITNLAYGDGLYLYAGAAGILATSTDAITWTARTSGTTAAISALVYGNDLYVAGSGGTVSTSLRTSTDGITWTARTTPFGTIRALIYVNKLFIASSGAGAQAFSTDAVTWSSAPQIPGSVNSLAYGNGRIVSVGVDGSAAKWP